MRLDSPSVIAERRTRPHIGHATEGTLRRLHADRIDTVGRKVLSRRWRVEIERRKAQETSAFVSANHSATHPVRSPQPLSSTCEIATRHCSAYCGRGDRVTIGALNRRQHCHTKPPLFAEGRQDAPIAHSSASKSVV